MAYSVNALQSHASLFCVASLIDTVRLILDRRICGLATINCQQVSNLSQDAVRRTRGQQHVF